VAKRPPTDPAPAPTPGQAPAGRRPRARRETAELTVHERARTSGFWGNRQPRALSEAVTMIAPEPEPKPKSARAPTANARRPGSGSDDFLDEVATNVVTEAE
jgi:hypothetical protein